MKNGLGFGVLIVEDDPDVSSALSEALTRQGYEVETAGTAEERTESAWRRAVSTRHH